MATGFADRRAHTRPLLIGAGRRAGFTGTAQSHRTASAAARQIDEAGAAPAADRPPVADLWIAHWSKPADTAVALLVLLVVVYASGGGVTMPESFAEFLAMRVTLKNVVLLALFVMLWPAALQVVGAYDRRRIATVPAIVMSILAGCALGSIAAFFVPLAAKSGLLGVLTVPVLWAGTVVGTVGVRIGARLAAALNRMRSLPVRVVIAGTGPRAAAIWQEMRRHPATRYELVALADLPEAPIAGALDGHPLVPVGELEQFLMRTVVDEVVVALPVRSRYEEIEQVLEVCERTGVHSLYLADAFSPTIARARVGVSGGFSVVSMHVVHDDWRLHVKRTVDVLVAFVALVVLMPVLLAIGVAIKVSSPGPVLFRQERFGYRKRRFRMLKFRSMVPDAEARLAALEAQNEVGGAAFKMKRDPRVTPIGAFLRRTSLDELPQLWHVLTGEMSLVGPRPMSVRDVSLFDEAWLMRRFSVRPGLTCLWQVGGRSDLSFERWMELDLQYIDDWSLSLDTKILCQTVPAVLRGSGAA